MENNNSIWLKSVKGKRKYRTLNKNIETEVCIIGGGITGVSTAYYLSKQGKKVVLVEKDEICSKTSGKTTAKITSEHHLFYDYLINSKGKEFAKKYLKANENAINNIEKIVKEENIDCDFERASNFIWTNELGKLQKIKDEVQYVKSLGFNCKFVNEIEILGKVEGAIEFPNQAKFNPYEYVNSLASCSLKYGADIFENSKAIEYLKDDEGFIISVEVDGVVRKIFSKYLVVATRYPIFNIPGFHFLKMYQEIEYGIAIKTDKQVNGMYLLAEVPAISFRETQIDGEKYVLILGNGHKTGEKEKNNDFKYLELFAQDNFPNCEIICRWNAEDTVGLDKIPYIGEYSEFRENMYVATGFKKWGMTSSNISANIITDKILDKKNKYEDIFDSTRFEPIKNRDELKNMIKEAGESVIMPRIKMEKGKKYCAHLGCELKWNEITKTWDCPCHGSRYEHDGTLIEGPSVKNLD